MYTALLTRQANYAESVRKPVVVLCTVLDVGSRCWFKIGAVKLVLCFVFSFNHRRLGTGAWVRQTHTQHSDRTEACGSATAAQLQIAGPEGRWTQCTASLNFITMFTAEVQQTGVCEWRCIFTLCTIDFFFIYLLSKNRQNSDTVYSQYWTMGVQYSVYVVVKQAIRRHLTVGTFIGNIYETSQSDFYSFCQKRRKWPQVSGSHFNTNNYRWL